LRSDVVANSAASGPQRVLGHGFVDPAHLLWRCSEARPDGAGGHTNCADFAVGQSNAGKGEMHVVDGDLADRLEELLRAGAVDDDAVRLAHRRVYVLQPGNVLLCKSAVGDVARGAAITLKAAAVVEDRGAAH